MKKEICKAAFTKLILRSWCKKTAVYQNGWAKLRKQLERPSEEHQFRVFSNVFEAFKSIDLGWKEKYAGFERILWESKQIDHWVAKAITHDALSMIAKNGFKKYNPEIVRGHIMARKIRAEKLFSSKFKSNKDAFDFFMQEDKVTLITKTAIKSFGLEI